MYVKDSAAGSRLTRCAEREVDWKWDRIVVQNVDLPEPAGPITSWQYFPMVVVFI